jgi:hypothetical protein
MPFCGTKNRIIRLLSMIYEIYCGCGEGIDRGEKQKLFSIRLFVGKIFCAFASD